MNDYKTITKLFENDEDEIGFRLFKESNIIKLDNNNQGNYNDCNFEFNTKSLSSKIIDYKNSYIETDFTVEIPYDQSNEGKKSVPKLISLKKSYEIVKSLKIQLNNVIILNKTNLNKANLINYVLINSYNSPASYKNILKSSSLTLNIANKKFITKDTNYEKKMIILKLIKKNHFIDFKIPIYLRDISDFFRKLDIIQFAEFQINLELIDNILASSRKNIKYTISNAFLYTE